MVPGCWSVIFTTRLEVLAARHSFYATPRGVYEGRKIRKKERRERKTAQPCSHVFIPGTGFRCAIPTNSEIKSHLPVTCKCDVRLRLIIALRRDYDSLPSGRHSNDKWVELLRLEKFTHLSPPSAWRACTFLFTSRIRGPNG